MDLEYICKADWGDSRFPIGHVFNGLAQIGKDVQIKLDSGEVLLLPCAYFNIVEVWRPGELEAWWKQKLAKARSPIPQGVQSKLM